MSLLRRAIGLFCASIFILSIVFPCLGQALPPLAVEMDDFSVLVVRVQGPDGAPFQTPADVSLLRPKAPAIHESTQLTGSAQFSGLAKGNYSVVVTAPGYKPAQDQITVNDVSGNLQAVVRLEPIASRSAVTGSFAMEAVPRKLQKDISKGLEALHDGRWDAAEKRFKDLYERAPDEPTINFLLGYTSLQKYRPTPGAENADLQNAERYLLRAASIDPHSPAAFAALGELRLKQQDFADAGPLFERAIALDPANWTAHSFLAAVYLKQQRYADAKNEAAAAVQAGKGAGNESKFLLAQAEAGLGETAEAIKALQSFLGDAPSNASAPAAQSLLASLVAKLASDEKAKQHAEEIRAAATAATEKLTPIADTSANSTLPALANGTSGGHAALAMPVWAPPGVDEIHPAVASGTACSTSQVLSRAEMNVQSLVTNIGNIEASEFATHQELSETGNALHTTERRYNYVASFDEIRPGELALNEVRNGIPGPDIFSSGIAASGLTGIALVFHPDFVNDFQMTCEGLGDWRGHPAWILYFRQHENKAGRISGYTVKGKLYRLALKGRAWIDSGTFQLLHIEADLLNPVPQIRLTLQHMSVNYSPVHFHTGRQVWLPSTGDMYFEFRGQRLHQHVAYSRYKFFSVSTSQRIDTPPAPPDVNAP